ncbi:MAG: bifunctional (p)ppGpp synthetase/guanosine-3',5'-bis(diphosphate) 3'-pyrophosphohydrolase, partial [Alphaproteobacteria bacterium]|nr:bifunctional (p)ppGpp synthetase/guanosine-3',5'-bis(diphosphate) 3'-pyrophosphohydrolase [Alphaproteobacteria bacterium]
HWNYKTGRSENVNVDEQWLQNLANVLGEDDDDEVLLKHTKMGLHSNEVFCITPKGLILSLPDGATVLDFAYHIHSDVGNHAVGAKINGTSVPLSTRVETGAKIEILTNAKSHPQRSWIKWLTTSKAKTALQKELNAFGREAATAVGRSSFVDFFKQFDIKVSDDEVIEIAKKFKFDHSSNLFYAIGTSSVLMEQVLDVYNELEKTNLKISDIAMKQPARNEEKANIDYKNAYTAYVKKLPISGLPRLPISPTTCCKPIPGDRIYGICNKDGEVEVHIEECPVFVKMQKEVARKITQLSWDSDAFETAKAHSVKLEISLEYAPGNLEKIGEIVEQNDGKISTLSFGEKLDSITQVYLGLEIQSIAQLTRITSTISHADFVRDIRRV